MNQDDRLGPYRLLRRLGEGGMGVVHLALDPHGRQVAVKVLRPEVAGDDVARRRLSREVETMRRVRNPHIAEVVDADVTGQRPYIVTRYVPGRALDEIIKKDGPLPLDALLKVARGVAEALAAVHASGVIHRDLKPGNVLMLDGRPVLIDFGIAQAVDATRLTQTGMFIGTPGYLAPEIIEGHEAGPEVDVHAWAGTLLYAATGLPPFGKGTLEMIFFNITSGKANVVAAPAPLQPVLRAAFHRDPSRRPTAAELVRRVAELMPPAGGPPRVPDHITTVPNVDETSGQPVPDFDRPGASGPHGRSSPPMPSTGAAAFGGQGSSVAGSGVAGSGAGGSGGAGSAHASPGGIPFVAPPVAPVATPPSSSPSPSAEEFVSLLRDTPAAGHPGDPFPTVRVTGEDLRRAGIADSAPARPVRPEGDIPTRFEPGSRGAPPQPAPGRPEGDIATRFDPAGSRGVSTPSATPGSPEPPMPLKPSEGDVPTWMAPPAASMPPTSAARPAGPGSAPPSDWDTPMRRPDKDIPTRRVTSEELRQAAGTPRDQAFFEQAAEIYEQTPHIHQQSPAPFLPTVRVPPPTVPPSPLPAGVLLQRSKAYGVASALLLVVMTCLAVIAPLLVCMLALPVAVLLRAADIAQPQLASRRPAGAAATDVIRVLGQPAALVKSIGVTIALVPYALVLGLPVTLLLTVLVGSMPVLAALSWGIAVALWTVCAGPGVEGPGRQMRRTLASLFPGGGAAKGAALGIGVLAVLVAAIALSSVLGKQTAGHFWGPIDVLSVVTRLGDLQSQAGNG
ncbi:protein kinase [Microbispora sp. NPDC049125]|uniref:protein kinase domain-containing protein n=1 Tax=Microbispora sp. NPDC049125 TaxID=3154929 RepID=UPI003466E59C